MPLPTSRELREMLEEATPGPWEFDFANLMWDERPASTVFWVSGDGPLDIAQRDAQSENRDQTEQNFTLIALAPQLAEEVIRLREEIKAMYPPPKTTEFLVERKIAGRWYPVGTAETFKAAGEMLRHYLAQGDQVRWSKDGQELPIQGGSKHDHR